MMYSLAFLAITSFILAFLLTPLVRNLARKRGWVDRPDRHRHLHPQPVPRLGGVPIFISYLAALGLLLLSPLSAGEIVRAGLPLAKSIFPAAALVFAAGIVDDLRHLKPWQKLAAQTGAACIAFWAGVQITAVAGWTIPLWLSMPMTLLWLVGCSNAFNLIDGMDGLAAGSGIFATVTILLGGLLYDNMALALATVPLAGALLGFLRYNFNPASIFLGDSGSLTLGFLLGCYSVMWGQKSAVALGMTAPLLALAVPLLDTTVAIGRRFIRGQRIWEADHQHLHHRLLDRGLTPRKAVLLLYAACGFAAVLSLLCCVRENHLKGAVVVLSCAAAWIGLQHLGYVEFSTAGRMFIDGAFRRHLACQLALRTFEDSLAAAQTDEDKWKAIREACGEFGFTKAELQLNGNRFEETLETAGATPTWQIQIPLENSGYMHLTRSFESQRAPSILVPFAEALHRGLSANPLQGQKGTRGDVKKT